MATIKSNSSKRNQKFEQFQSSSLDKDQQKHLKGGNGGSGDGSGQEEGDNGVIGTDDIILP